jgi:hypothetical protein
MGTALTEHQLRELGRLTKRLYLCFDADAAGQEATLRGMRRPEVQRAAATFRWTGSWHTVFPPVTEGLPAEGMACLDWCPRISQINYIRENFNCRRHVCAIRGSIRSSLARKAIRHS